MIGARASPPPGDVPSRRRDEAKQSYLEEGLVILSLAQEAPDLFAKANREEKRELLQHLLSNSAFADGKLTVEWRKPYVYLMDFANPLEEQTPPKCDGDEGASNMVGLVVRLTNWLAGLTEEDVAWARRGLGAV